jgi:hypothetical protein
MTLIIQKPTGAKLVLAQNYPADDDSRAYIAAVEAADGQSLESGVKMAIDAFVLGCKADGIWTAIKASCIIAGARTLTGALVPLVGTAPTNVGPFVSGDYNRETGLVGDGSTKYLDSNTPNSAAPLNNSHVSIFASTQQSSNQGRYYIGAAETNNTTGIGGDTNVQYSTWVINDAGSAVPRFQDAGTGFKGLARSNSNNYVRRTSAISSTITRAATATAPGNQTFGVFARNNSALSNARLAFYSIGESLDLTLLDARVTDLINAFAAAIP